MTIWLQRIAFVSYEMLVRSHSTAFSGLLVLINVTASLSYVDLCELHIHQTSSVDTNDSDHHLALHGGIKRLLIQLVSVETA